MSAVAPLAFRASTGARVAAPLAVISAAAAGCLVAGTAAPALALALILVLAVLLCIATRALLRRGGQAALAGAEAVAAPHRLARAAFLVGLLLAAQLVFRPVLALTASDLAFAAAFAAAAAALALSRRESGGSLPPALVVGAGLFVIGACVSQFRGDTPAAALGVTGRFVVLTLAWFWLATLVLRRAAHVQAAVACWVASVGLSGVAAIAQLFRGDVIPNTDAAWGRMTGMAQHVNDLGGSAAVALPAAVALALAPGLGRGRRVLAIAAASAIASGLVLSGSVGSMLAAVCGLAVAAVAARRKAAFVAAGVLVAGATAVTSRLQSAELSTTLPDRIDSVTSPSGTFHERLDVFGAAWTRIVADPLVGHGFGFDPRLPGSELPDLIHNAFLSVWYQGGLAAVAGLAVICAVTIRSGVRAVRGATGEAERLLAASLLGAFAAYLVFGLGEPTLYARYGWIPAALLLALEASRPPPYPEALG